VIEARVRIKNIMLTGIQIFAGAMGYALSGAGRIAYHAQV